MSPLAIHIYMTCLCRSIYAMVETGKIPNVKIYSITICQLFPDTHRVNPSGAETEILWEHCSDVTMTTMASQLTHTRLMFSCLFKLTPKAALLTLCEGSTEGQWRGKSFHGMTSSWKLGQYHASIWGRREPWYCSRRMYRFWSSTRKDLHQMCQLSAEKW